MLINDEVSKRIDCVVLRGIQLEEEMCEREGAVAARRRSTEAARLVADLLRPGGHGVRMRLLLHAAEQGCHAEKATIDSAANAVELLHFASLVHDDIIDRAERRRTAPTGVARWGSRVASLVGGVITARAVGQVGACGADAAAIFAAAATDMCVGGLNELSGIREASRSADDHLNTASRKTGSLLSASGRLGAMLSGAGAEECQAVADFGRNLGIAWQIWDDALDLAADPAQTGKSASDLSGGVITLPVILALEVDSDLRCDFTIACENGEELQRFRKRIIETDALKQTVAIADQYAALASANLDLLPEPDGLRALLTETRERHGEILPVTMPASFSTTSVSPVHVADAHDGRLISNLPAAISVAGFADLGDLVTQIESSDPQANDQGDSEVLASAVRVTRSAVVMMNDLPLGALGLDDARMLLVADYALTYGLHLVAGRGEGLILEFAERAEALFEQALEI